MAPGIDPSSNSTSQDPYLILGLNPGASFDDVQTARDNKLSEAGENPQARAKIEASYESLLMVSLKERQLGKVSQAAVNASKKEDGSLSSAATGLVNNSFLARLTGPSDKKSDRSSDVPIVQLSLPEKDGLLVRLAIGILALVLLLISSESSTELILSVSTIAVFISQVKRGRKALPSLGWSVVLLSIGLNLKIKKPIILLLFREMIITPSLSLVTKLINLIKNFLPKFGKTSPDKSFL